MELLNSEFRILFSDEKPEVQNSPNNFVCQMDFVIFLLLYYVHGIRRSKVVYVEEVVILSLKIEGIISISLLPFPIIYRRASISCKDRPFALFESEVSIESLAQSIGVVAIDFRPNL